MSLHREPSSPLARGWLADRLRQVAEEGRVAGGDAAGPNTIPPAQDAEQPYRKARASQPHEDGHRSVQSDESVGSPHRRRAEHGGAAGGSAEQGDYHSPLGGGRSSPMLYGEAVSLSSGELNPHEDLSVLSLPNGARARSMQVLHAQLASRLPQAHQAPALAVTSFDSSVGRSSIAANLAVLFARSGLRVLLIDASFANSRQLELFGCAPTPGLADWICGSQSLHGIVFDDLPGLTLMPAGEPGRGLSEKLAHPGFRRWLGRLSGKDQIVLIDTGAASVAVETQAVCAAAGGALMVARRNTTPIRSSADYVQQLAERGVAFFGAAIVG